jgi:hypothetical protein
MVLLNLAGGVYLRFQGKTLDDKGRCRQSCMNIH